ncbi:histidyl-tRNA synthetase [Rhodoligotrophos appendicifer]|uniref:histidine--tRNA ligase n=1 Tax=Rhodoligotrophos appendicifer TaxID=987056 RepID=UPI0011859C08|nr:histidine--tRNA ligase [Rhodoligotrophos appendicifer]
MSKTLKSERPKARVAKGFRDVEASEIRALKKMLQTIEQVYESYGFDPVETPTIEYTDALGKFLPDQDRPNEGVFSFQDEDDQWLSLRYDLTAPLARYVAEHYDSLPKPYRSYRSGWVYRNEKPGPGRFRQFMQFDADTVGTSNPAADAEICMLAADTLEALGIPRGSYVIRVNNRKILDGVMEAVGLTGIEDSGRRLTVLRAIDKLDKIGLDGVKDLLTSGRTDASGDVTKGAGLIEDNVTIVLAYLQIVGKDGAEKLAKVNDLIGSEDLAISETVQLLLHCKDAGYEQDRITFDPSVVRGLEYYTGPVFEAELLFDARNEEGEVTRFGSVGGGGRYDGLVERFRGEKVPATGFSIGVSRLYAALKHLGKIEDQGAAAPVVVLVMDKERMGDYQAMVTELRQAGLRAEMYLGTSGMKAQMKYADRRGSPCVIIQGGDELARGEVQVKDLVAGAEAAKAIEGRDEWREARPAQVTVKRDALVAAVQEILARYS